MILVLVPSALHRDVLSKRTETFKFNCDLNNVSIFASLSSLAYTDIVLPRKLISSFPPSALQYIVCVSNISLLSTDITSTDIFFDVPPRRVKPKTKSVCCASEISILASTKPKIPASPSSRMFIFATDGAPSRLMLGWLFGVESNVQFPLLPSAEASYSTFSKNTLNVSSGYSKSTSCVVAIFMNLLIVSS